jgi:kinetochore protein NNF1
MAGTLGSDLNTHHTALNAELERKEQDNIRLGERIVQQRAEMDTLVRGLEALVSDLQKAAEMVQAPEIQNLAQETRTMHSELRE